MKSPVLVSKIALTFAALTLALVSCGQSGKQQAAVDEVALTVNGEAITQGQIDEVVEAFRWHQSLLSPENVFDVDAGSLGFRRGAARQLAANVLMLEDLKTRGWVVDTAVLDARLNSFIARVGGRESFEAQLAAMGGTEEDLRKNIEEDILLDSLLSVVSAVDSIEDSEARAHYEANKARYTAPGRIRASHIIFTFDPSSDDPGQVAGIMARASEALEKVNSGADFEKTAKEYSSMPDNIDMGWFRRGELMPDLESALFALKKGEITSLVPSGMGIHILKKTGEEEPRQREYEEVRDNIKRTLTTTRRAVLANNYIDSLLAAADIRYIDQSLIIEKNEPERSEGE